MKRNVLAGMYNDGPDIKACYWIDGIKHDLPEGTNVLTIAIAVE